MVMAKDTAKNTKQPAAASAPKGNKKGTEKKVEEPAPATPKPTENAGVTKPQEVKQSHFTSCVQLPTIGEIVPPESISFPKLEEAVLAHWQRIRAFETSVKFSEGRPRYTFYDGPPFATGLPHYGHLLAGSIKDVMCRWAHQSGFYVERRFGWDCHGLPVEYEIDKKLGIRGPDDVLKMGITKYNAECRSIVSRYSNEWEAVVSRMGRWIDFRNDYKTMYPWFMESVWWVFKELYHRGLVYRGVKVMPFSTACSTPLSNFESGQNYKDVTDPAVMVGFPLEDEPSVSLVAWTTTPWTLPSNLALCVNPDMKYVKVRDAKTGSIYILMEARLEGLYKRHPQPASAEQADTKNKSDAEYAVLDRFDGKTLVGRRYVPLFKYFEDMRTRTGAFRVVADGYVTSDSGTGIVHQAPYFGEDDFRVCLRERIISKEMKPICPVDDAGRFTSEVTDFAGLHVKEADKSIMEKIKDLGRLVNRATTTHSYPFCWRSDTPLIYKAVPSWFVRVEAHSSDLLAALDSTYWVPDFVKSKRFANWLTDARDWAISRSRFWGTPIPLWVSEDLEEIVCVGSIEELARLTGVHVTDLHRENIDHLTIKSARPGMPDLRRVPEVFDCWFESGSMPYAQMHFPFKNQRLFLEEQFPADFIAEGIDQTRGWFYTLLVISTLLFGKAPFKNLIVNGIVLASDGQKMSKRLKNYPDPSEIIGRFGADALRLYLVNSPAVRADNLRFKEEGVNDIIKQFFLPFYHSYRYLLQCVARYQKEQSTEFTFDEIRLAQPTNFMDKWILSVIQSLLKFVKAEMREYRLYTVLAKLVRFIDDLTNWYVKMNRKRLKGDGSNTQDNYEALQTLFAVQLTIVKLLAPFTPFLTEFIYLGLKRFLVGVAYREPTELDAKNVSDKDSVHFLPLPEIRQDFIDEKIEQTVSAMQTVVDLGRVIRERKTLPLKLPLREAVVICTDEEKLAHVREMEKYIKAELNIKRLHTTSRASDYQCTFKFDMDFKRLGQRFRKDRERVEQLVKAMNADQVRQFNEAGTILLDGRYELTSEDLRVSYTFENKTSQQQSDAAQDDTPQYEADSRGDLLVLVDCRTNAALLDEFAARKFLNIVQKLRKRHALQPTDTILVGLESAAEVKRIVTQTHAELVNATLKQPLLALADSQSEAAKRGWKLLGEETVDLHQDRIRVCLFGDSSLLRATTTIATAAAPSEASADAPIVVRGTPSCTFRNLLVKLRDGRSLHCTRLSENPQGQATPPLDTSSLLQELRLCNAQCTVAPDSEQKTPFCRFVNVSLVDANGAEKKTGTVLLENPRGNPSFTSTAEVRHFVHRLFAVTTKRFSEVQLFEKDAKGQLAALQLTDGVQLVEALNGRTLVCKA